MLKIQFKHTFSHSSQSKVERKVEMPEEEFAWKVATILLKNPEFSFDESGKSTNHMAERRVIANILDLDLKDLEGAGYTTSDLGYSYSPGHIAMDDKVSGGKLVEVKFNRAIGYADSREEHYYFRRGQNNELTYLPYAEKCPYRVENGNIADPWIYLFPEKFKGVMEFAEVLTPGDENPLTGLVSSKDAPVRTLTKQVIRKLEAARDNWLRDIVSSL